MTSGREGHRRTKVGHALSCAGIGSEEDPADVRVRMRAEIIAWCSPSPDGLRGVVRTGRTLATLPRQAATYGCYSVTLLDVFTRDRGDS